MPTAPVYDLGRPPRALLIAAVAVAVVAIGAILAIAATRHAPPQPVILPAVSAPQATNASCRALADALPQRLGDYQRASLAQPAPPAAAGRGPGARGRAGRAALRPRPPRRLCRGIPHSGRRQGAVVRGGGGTAIGE